MHLLPSAPQQGSFEGQGGSIYNRGNIVVGGESFFSLGTAAVRRYLGVIILQNIL